MLVLTRSAFAVLAALAFAAGTGSKNDGERLKNLIGRKAEGVGVQEQLMPKQVAALQAATRLETDAVKECRVYVIDKGDLTAAFVDLAWTGRPRRIGAAFDKEAHLRHLGAFDEFGKPTTDLDSFLAQFQGEFGLRLSDGSLDPIGDVAALRDAVAAGGKPPAKPQDRLRHALLRQRQMMWRLDRVSNAIQAEMQNGKAPPADALRELRVKLGEVDALSGELKSIFKPKDLGQYREFVRDLGAKVDTAIASLDAGDADAARKTLKLEAFTLCGKCHGFDGNQWRRPFQSELRDQRNTLGVKDGVFVIDVDVRPGELPPEDAQAIASTVKAAFLLATNKL